MKAIEQVLEIFPNTKAAQWKQHANGQGWVYETAYAAATAYIAGVVFGNAQVYGNAQVSGNAQVYGNARVYGDSWVKTPPYIQGTRHAMTLCSFTELAIGCHLHSIAVWKKEYKKIGIKEGYTKAEIKEYGEYITLMAKTAARLKRGKP